MGKASCTGLPGLEVQGVLPEGNCTAVVILCVPTPVEAAVKVMAVLFVLSIFWAPPNMAGVTSKVYFLPLPAGVSVTDPTLAPLTLKSESVVWASGVVNVTLAEETLSAVVVFR